MGVDIHQTEFAPEDYARFSARLRECLQAMRELLARPAFGHGPRTLGAELELFLVDCAAEPMPLNRTVLAENLPEEFVVELNRFNLEVNLAPLSLAGRPFTRMAEEIRVRLAQAARAAEKSGARITPIGILPTLRETHLGSWALTDSKRYHALSAAARRDKQGPFELRIEGRDRLTLDCDDVTAEGANTSFQVHLRVSPADFAAIYNAAQIATGPVLAACGNSPFFVGRRLWEETRIALFRQSLDDRPSGAEWRPSRISFGHGWVRGGPHELFREAVRLHPPLLPVLSDEEPLACVRRGQVPALSELRLHHGTVWRWNRAIYDGHDGGHFRVELRALPAGPTAVDMSANAAFLLGLTLAIAPRIDDFLDGMTFGHARRNFYEAAREGLAASLLWPCAEAPSPRAHLARELLPMLIAMAREGLVANGVEAAEADSMLTVLERRVATGATGACWQRGMLDRLEAGGLDRDRALRRLLEHYVGLSTGDRPVHEWPLENR